MIDPNVPDDELVHDRVKEQVPVPTDGFEIERLVLIELNKKMQEQKKTTAQKTVERLAERSRSTGASPARVPAELVREAVRQGSRSPELGLWVAAAALLLAAGVNRGRVPGVVRGVIAGVRGLGARGVSARGPVRGPGGLGLFDARSRIASLMNQGVRRLFDSERTGAGEFFAGTEG